jgi:signal transduction histidine kinase
MARLAGIIRTHQATILELWTTQAQQVAAARGLDRPEFQNIIPELLRSLADADDDLGRFQGERRKHVERHLSSRLRQGFQLAEIVDEFALLGRCITGIWSSGSGIEPPDHTEVENLFQELHLASAAVTETFTRHMLEDEQTEKQYLRLIQTVALEALQPDAPRLRERLKEVLALVMEAMGAQSAALLLYNPLIGKLEMAASVGGADEELERYVTSLGPSSFAGQVAAHEPAAVTDAETTELEVSDNLRRSGIHSLLGVRLPPRHRLLGVMYVGLAERRSFTAREVRRLESLGQQLVLHMDNAKLYADLRAHIDGLDSERELRERFVSVLAHDLRGPLAAAKMASQILMQHPEHLDERRDLAMRIDRNIDRADRMVRDLLDANRIRAGERLPLRIEECDLGVLAREVYEELFATFGDRFMLEVESRVRGFWSAEELRRAVWNLATNAVKYGAAEEPISLTVRRTPQGAEVSVHNWGTPITAEDQRLLFRPFSRTPAAAAGGQKGWGLGLTLVHACADAHGGRVSVESTKEAGTTFTIALPPDARPYQAEPPSRTMHS